MSSYKGLSGLSISQRGTPPHGLKTNALKSSKNKYKNLKPSEQKNTSGQRRALRKETR